ncbi:uncharacterized protein [Asterias amurensis]|uniref:uncharacterized protein n=1 Tax=Asterias amurensis TaxID=7602 RepID=UPI003AB6D2B0
MDEERENTSGGKEEATEMETSQNVTGIESETTPEMTGKETNPEAALTNTDTTQDETLALASSTSHNKDSSKDLVTDSDVKEVEVTTSPSLDLIPTKDSSGNIPPPENEKQQNILSEELKSTNQDSSALIANSPGEGGEDEKAERGETKPDSASSSNGESKQLTEISPPDSKTTVESLNEKDVKTLTVTSNVEVDVVDESIALKTEVESVLYEAQHVLPDETAQEQTPGEVADTPPSSNINAVMSPEVSVAENEEMVREDSNISSKTEPTPSARTDSTVSVDRRYSSVSNARQTNNTTPSKPGTPETGISIATKGDLPSRFTTPHPPSQQLQERPLTHATVSTEFGYDEMKDFTSPDYEYTQTPLYSVRGDSGVRQDRKTFSRGESVKSVTFADDLTGRMSAKELGVEEEDEGTSSEEESDTETAPEKGTEADEKLAIKDVETKEQQGEDKDDLFPTAVSEEKIEEAKQKRKERAEGDAARRENLFGIFGQPRLDKRRSMEEVVGSKAREHFDKGCVLLSNLENSQAIVCFDKAINLCPKEVRYYLMRGEAYLQMCDFQSAILNMKKACVLDPNNDAFYIRLAFVYYFQGQTLFDQCLFAEALESFSRASEMRPEVIGYHTRSVACLAALQRHGECLALVNKRLEVEQHNPDLYIMRARLHELFRNTSLCYYDLKDAIALDPDREEAQNLMVALEAKAAESRDHAVRLQLQGKLKEAMNKITAAVETNPAVADYHLLRGALHRRLHDYNAAIDDFLLALDKTDHNEQNRIYMEAQRQLLLTYNDFAVECFLGAYFEEAIILLNKAIKGEKREKGLYVNRGDCFFRLNELHFALADYHQALELDHADWTIRSRIASIHSEFGLMDYEEHSYKEAEARFTVAIQHNPRVGSYFIYRSKVRFMLENQAGARHDLLVTLHLEPNNEEILTLMPRLFPGKSITDIMRSKSGRAAKAEVENAVVTASPVRLPALNGDATNKEAQPNNTSPQATSQAGAKHVSFASAAATPSGSVMPDLKECMNEIGFNTVLAKKKKKVSNHVKSLLHDRQTLWTDAPKLAPQPPPRPYAIRGGALNKNQSNIDTSMGWRSFSMGVGLK